MDIITILSQIDLGSFAMPVFQRGYVWNRDQVRKLMTSLYKGYPIGSLLVWDTTTDPTISKGDGALTPGHVNLILDGQQRMTSLYGIIRGVPPKFFDGNANSFTGLYFNVDTEIFEFYLQMKMKSEPAWISVTELMQKGASVFMQEKMMADPSPANTNYWLSHMAVLNRLDAIKKLDIYIQTVSGEDKTIDVVVDIFNNVNSGGTKLSKGDLALAKICGQWTEARDEMKKILSKYHNAGYDFSMDWLLRCITVYLTGQPYFAGLEKIDVLNFKTSLPKVDKVIGDCLDHIGSRLGLDHARVMGNVFGIVTMIGYLGKNNWKLADSAEWDKLLYWYVHAFLWGRYASSTESALAQDLNTLKDGGGIDGLIAKLKQTRGDLTIRPEDFWGWSTGARFYPLLYLLTRTGHARDWGSDVELKNALLGGSSSLDVHHIFPKDVLYKAGKSKAIVNALANYAFLTKATNIAISNKKPEDYFPVYRKKCPGAMDTHWIPNDPNLWKVENYEKFLEERRKLLADAANSLLDLLYNGKMGTSSLQSYSSKQYVRDIDEEEELEEMINWMEGHGLNSGTMNHELLKANSDEVEAIIDLAWPQGIQTGLGEPIALLLNETAETQAIVSAHGYRYYTSVNELKEYITHNYLE
ncbi:DUF262 domain-containing protein [Phascolarctobacterium sp.]|uniref:GmrSD restriction endonuclease domain-containing protein n=1 Tax=Phascolarctobacterium sp. TaxID=2049039 RepID=UPI0038642162